MGSGDLSNYIGSGTNQNTFKSGDLMFNCDPAGNLISPISYFTITESNLSAVVYKELVGNIRASSRWFRGLFLPVGFEVQESEFRTETLEVTKCPPPDIVPED